MESRRISSSQNFLYVEMMIIISNNSDRGWKKNLKE
jgi:hypothetical protein